MKAFANMKAAKSAKVALKKPKKNMNVGGGTGSSRIKISTTKKTNLSPKAASPQTLVIQNSRSLPPIISIDLSRIQIFISIFGEIIGDYQKLFINKIQQGKFTLYDLIIFINNITARLNKFFENFLDYYPYIKFEKNRSFDFYDNMLKYQSKFIYLINYIHRYIVNIGKTKRIGNLQYQFPLIQSWNGYHIDSSSILYGAGLYANEGDKDMLVKSNYKKSDLYFFKSYLDYPRDNLEQLKQFNISFNTNLAIIQRPDDLYFIESDHIIKELHNILEGFFDHIKSSITNGYVPENKREKDYINTLIFHVKENAKINSVLLNTYYTTFIKPGLNPKVQSNGVFNPLSVGYK
jgi:hypothetical protein